MVEMLYTVISFPMMTESLRITVSCDLQSMVAPFSVSFTLAQFPGARHVVVSGSARLHNPVQTEQRQLVVSKSST